jgi:Leucine-rich repeat (LRR) protein
MMRLLRKTIALSIAAFGLAAAGCLDEPCGGDEVVFADERLEQAVRNSLDSYDRPLCPGVVDGLTEIAAGGWSIGDLDGVQSLTALRMLELWSNRISDLAPLSGLTSLSLLDLAGNEISDLAPLVANAGIGAGDYVYISENPIDEAAQAENIAALCGRGVRVDPFCPYGD